MAFRDRVGIFEHPASNVEDAELRFPHNTLAMICKLAQSAEKRRGRLQGYNQLGEILSDIKFINFKDGIRVDPANRSAA